MTAMNHLLQISAMHWLQAFGAAAIAAVVLHLVAHLVGALLLLLAALSLLFAAMALVKQLFVRGAGANEKEAE